ncbi:MAG TPA: hypothetical protein VGS12_17680 [Caulobacteraceae bacterium]|nr:hypothetical protein [Caulobacteraceae bacterium]
MRWGRTPGATGKAAVPLGFAQQVAQSIFGGHMGAPECLYEAAREGAQPYVRLCQPQKPGELERLIPKRS